MKPSQRGGVVDTRLNVYGVRGLKVAGESRRRSTRVRPLTEFNLDLSITPSNVASVRTSIVDPLRTEEQLSIRTRTHLRWLLERRPRL